MTFSVLWLPVAEQQLAEVWVNASDKTAVTEAAREIDRVLRLNPDRVGESRPDGRRILLEAPLGVVYRIDYANAVVRVVGMWRFGKSR
jgi:hypothetical protein